MAFTRDDDVNKTKLDVEQANNSLGYMLNVPGNGTTPDYIVDPQIRLQGFGILTTRTSASSPAASM